MCVCASSMRSQINGLCKSNCTECPSEEGQISSESGVRELKQMECATEIEEGVPLKKELAHKSTNSLRAAVILHTALCRLSLCNKEREKWRMDKIT